MEVSVKQIGIVVVGVIFLIIMGLSASSVIETNSAGNMQVKQAAFSGNLTCRLEPGMYLQMFGDVHTYTEATTFFFTADTETGERRDQSLPTRFNDGTQAKVSGSVRVILPQDCESLILIHRKFKSMAGVTSKLVLPAIRKALFSSGPHMSATESYAGRRSEFAALVEDQLVNGVIHVDKQ